MSLEKGVGFVVQCGGRGKRLRYTCPKPLIPLPDGSRPLSNVLQDIPKEFPVYIHLLREHEEAYSRFLGANNNFGHRISYLIQQEGTLHDRHLSPITYPDGTLVTASNGSATFSRHFGNPPRYFCLVDGAKTGVYFEDVKKALKKLEGGTRTEAVAFARELSQNDLENEIENSRSSHTRYVRVHLGKKAVYEYPLMPRDIIGNAEWLALAGMYVVRSLAYIIKTRDMKGRLAETESADSLFTGYAYQLKLAMTLKGYNGNRSGLDFEVYKPKLYIPGIKTEKDIEEYMRLKEGGAFCFRKGCAA